MSKTTNKTKGTEAPLQYAILIESAIQQAPTTPQQALIASQGGLPKKNGWVGRNRDKADAFFLVEETLQNAKLFATKEEAIAFADFLGQVSGDKRVAGRSINVVPIAITAQAATHLVRNKYIPNDIPRAEKRKLEREANKKATKSNKKGDN